MGNFVKKINDHVHVIASDRLWIEDSACQQLEITARLPGMAQVVGLPDLHPGRGYPVGAAFFSVDRFYPALIGGDVGCGVGLWQTDLASSKVKFDKLDRQIGNLDHSLSEDEFDRLCEEDQSLSQKFSVLRDRMLACGLDDGWLKSLGTVGLGNHFIELQSIVEVNDPLQFEKIGLEPKRLQLVVHSGSRGLGQAILRSHVDMHNHAGLSAGTDADDYLAKHAVALDYASLNRSIIALRVLTRLKCSSKPVLDVHHNLVVNTSINGQVGWLHRKGANPSDQGVVVLPGSRDDYSYIIAPKLAEDSLSLKSLAHGAGRKWQRSDCKDRLVKLATPSDMSRSALGGRVICEDKSLIYEEAGQAYKDVDTVLGSLVGAGLVDVIAKSKPVLTYKTRGECC